MNFPKSRPRYSATVQNLQSLEHPEQLDFPAAVRDRAVQLTEMQLGEATLMLDNSGFLDGAR